MNQLIEMLERRHTVDRGLLEAAYALAAEAHAGQKRKTGDDYITHPLAVAAALAEWGLDQPTVLAGLLHDVVEDSEIPLTRIEREFGPLVAELVDGVTKLGEIELSSGDSAYVENLRKMLLAITRDIRVLIVKLADRYHNMQTLVPLSPADQVRIARETMEVYVPLANRLGMGELKAELEDLSFRYLEPERYRVLRGELQGVLKDRERYIVTMKRFLRDRLREAGLEPEIEGRAKHLYSIAKKLEKQGELEKIYDLMAIRVIVPTVADCYKTLGLIHEDFKPLIYRIKDYIAVPKPNGYQSLHTTVFGPGGVITEIQIRTPEMHLASERGVAAHFFYDEMKGEKAYREGGSLLAPDEKLKWVTQLMDWQEEITSGDDFIEGLRLDVFRDRIFVFTPKGDVYDLPEGATPVDFAYRVHSRVGETCVGAKVNGKIVPLDRKLENRDIVEILTQKNSTPSRDWLSFVRTTGARSKIRAYFRGLDRAKHIELGRQQADRELTRLGKPTLAKLSKDRIGRLLENQQYRTLDDLYAGIGEGTVSVGQLLRTLFTREELGLEEQPRVRKSRGLRGEPKVVVAGQQGLSVSFRSCCHPVPGDPIVGAVTRREGITIHREQCSSLREIDPDRIIPAHWESGSTFSVRLTVRCRDRVGMLRDLTGAVSEQGLNIISIETRHRGPEVVILMTVEVEGVERLRELLTRLERVEGVSQVKRG